MRGKKHNNKQKDILFILGSSFVVVVAWIGFNIYHIYVTSTISEEIQVQLSPINPNFDKDMIRELKTRDKVVPLFEKQETASRTATTLSPTPTIELEQSASTAGQLETSTRFAPADTQIATRSGQ